VRSRVGASAAVFAFTGALLLGACSDSTPQDDRQAKIVAAAVRALVPPRTDDATVTRDVFLGNRTKDRDSVDLQADILQELDDYESIRFVDDRSEAIADEPPYAVHSDGVYLEIGPVPESRTRITVPALRYIDRDHQARLRLRVVRSGGVWTVTGIDEA
jgi:hypothetical protein